MQTKTLKVQEALNELSMLDSRISKKMNKLVAVGVEAEDKLVYPKRSKLTVDKFTTDAEADTQSITDLINYRTALRSAVIKSNGTTTVQVGKDTITVAEAIKRKELIEDEYIFLSILERQLQESESKAFNHNSKIDSELLEKEKLVLGSEKERKGDDTTLLEAIRKTSEAKRASIILPKINGVPLDEYIEAKNEELDYFTTNIGFILTASNVTTDITVEW